VADVPLIATSPVSSVDLAALVFLALFLLWGAFHGALRQLLGLLVLVCAFPIASATYEHLELAVSKVATLTPEGVACAAWSVAWFGVVVIGGVLLHLARPALHRARLANRWDALLGGTVGFAKGALLLGLIIHGVLAWTGDGAPPSLIRTLTASRASDVAARIERRVAPALRLPFPVEVRVERVHRRIAEERTT
jgi:hypothetical protein